ncbi:MAG: DUF2099 family protein [Methanomassiliicoccales archaeon]
MARHVVEMAKSVIEVEDGKVKVIERPRIRRCPLRRSLYGCESEDEWTVRRVLSSHIEDLGMYTSKRVLRLREDPVSFGASEMLSDALQEGLLDAAVVVCEGVGSVIIDRPEVLQAVGAHMTGIIYTEEIRDTRRRLERMGATTLGECRIDQVAGFALAVEKGYRKVAVTVTGLKPEEALKLRRMGRYLGQRATILAVHTTGISERTARSLSRHCDLVWACASLHVRRIIGPRALMQVGTGIPVFALTQEGKRIALNRAFKIKEPIIIQRCGLPCLDEAKQPEPLL